MLRRAAIRSNPRAREKPERVFKTPKAEPGKFRLALAADGAAVAQPKESAIEHEGYRRLVASLPCVRCNIAGYSQAAHPPATGKGIKQDDRLAVPLCCARPGIPGCHFLNDQYKLRAHAETVAYVKEMARQVRAVILNSGAWPRDLPKWEEGQSK